MPPLGARRFLTETARKNPLDLRTWPGLIAYFDARLSPLWSNTSRTTPATSAVATWDDISGNGRHATQATGTKQPTLTTINGVAAVAFDGTDDVLAMSNALSLLSTQARVTVVICARSYAPASGAKRILSVADNVGNGKLSLLRSSTGLAYGARRVEADTFTSLNANAVSGTTDVVEVAVFDFVTSFAVEYRNNVKFTMAIPFIAGSSPGPTSALASASAPTIGSDGGSAAAQVDLAMLAIFNTVFNQPDINAISAAYGRLYGLF